MPADPADVFLEVDGAPVAAEVRSRALGVFFEVQGSVLGLIFGLTSKYRLILGQAAVFREVWGDFYG